MLDIKYIRENPSVVRKNLERRQDPNLLNQLDEVIKLDTEWRKCKFDLDKLKHKRNELSQSINKLKKEGKDPKDVLEQVKNIPKEIKENQAKQEDYEKKIKSLLFQIPNLLKDDVPYGKDDTGNLEVKKWGEPREYDFELQNHAELLENAGLANFDRSAKISGHGFYFHYGDLVLLNQAIIQFTLQFLAKKGYTPIEPPFMLKKEAYEGVVSLEDFENVMYKIEEEDLYMIATSEHPLVTQHMNEVIKEEDLPIKYAGFSLCFRKEVGSRGIDTKGLFRTHQFNKVEQIILCTPEESQKFHDEITKNGEEIMQALEIPYRITNICTGDLGIIASKKFDIEAWSPRQKKYVEVKSSSNCTDYQARRLNIKCIDKNGNRRILHTLNNTAAATSRLLVAILENFQNSDGSITVPKVLRPFMMNIDKIGGKK